MMMLPRRTCSVLLLILVVVQQPRGGVSKRGPHHPRGELGKVNEHIVHSDEHLKADLEASHVQPGKPVEEMSTEEKQFYHFKMHDYDNNNLLDGLEILQSANVHDDTFHGQQQHSKKPSTASSRTDNAASAAGEELGLQHLVEIIDDFLLVADKNNDGFLNFNEYKDTLRDDHEPGAGDYATDAEEDDNTIASNNNNL